MISLWLFPALLLQTAPAPAVTPASVRVLTIEGETLRGEWAGVSENGELLLRRDGRTASVPADQLMLVQWLSAGPMAPPAHPSSVVHLADGSRLYARIVGGDARHIKIEAAAIGDLEVPLTRLAAIRFARAEHPDAQQAFRRALAKRDPSRDLLLVVRDDRVTTLRGVVESLRPNGGSFKWRNRSIPIDPAQAYALVMAKGVHRPDLAPVMCECRMGAIWAGRIIGGDAEEIELELTGGRSIPVKVTELIEIRFRSERVVFLSDLEPADYEFEPFAAARWPYRLNRSVANRPLRIGDQDFERGIGMHSKAVLTYELPGRFAQLAAVVGIDEAVGSLGNVVFRVLADDKEVFNSGPVTGRDDPRPILVPVDGARRLQLVVDFGEDLDVGDQADWGNVRLLK